MKAESTISEVRLKNNGELNPLIVEFMNGDIPEEKLSAVKAKLRPYESLSEKAVQISTPDNQRYLNNPTQKLLLDNKFIAIRNKKTNKIRLVEVGITPVINSLYFKKLAMKEDTRDTKEKFASLQRLFGTKKAVRNLERKEALDIDKSFVEVQINELLADKSIGDSTALQESLNKTSGDMEEEECLSDLIPPCHREATDIANVYRVEDCISEAEISSLSEGVEKLLQNEKNLQNESLFMQTFLPHALVKAENLKVKIALLLYADALITYLRAPAKSLSKISQSLCPHSKMIGDKIIRKFCIRSGHSLNRPLAMKDKAACYIIVLVLLACNYTIDLEALAKMSCFGYNKLRQLGRIIGVLPTGKTSSIHVLALPLPPPVKMVKTVRAVKKKM